MLKTAIIDHNLVVTGPVIQSSPDAGGEAFVVMPSHQGTDP